MGYSTDFTGSFALDRPLAPEHAAYLRQFRETRRMRRDAAIAATLPDPIRESAGLPVGPEGAYFVGGAGFCGQDHDASVRTWQDGNRAPSGQPGSWCQWVPNDECTAIEWDESGKFYNYLEWLEYLIAHFLGPWGYTLNGEVEWDGEEQGDVGKIEVADNVISVKKGKIVYE